MRRYAGTLAALTLTITLAACGGASTSTSTPRPGCSDDQLALDPTWHGDGATGTSLLTVDVRLVSGEPCMLAGFPRVRILDDEGRRLALRYRHIAQHGRRVVVSPDHPAQLTIGKYRCDIAPSARQTASATIVLPGLTTTRQLPMARALPICARQDPSQTVLVWPIARG